MILPASMGAHLPDGTVAVRLFETDLIETQLVWRAGDQNPVVSQFVELSTRVFGMGTSS